MLGFAFLLIKALVVYHICFGIAEYAKSKNNFALEITARKRWKFILFTWIAAGIFILIASLIKIPNELALFMIVPLFILVITGFILLLGLVRQAAQLYITSPQVGPDDIRYSLRHLKVEIASLRS